MQALRAARLFDGRDVVDEPVVVVDGGTIAEVGRPAPSGTEVVDLGDVTVLPGLVDAHQHLVFDGNGSIEEQVAGRSDDELRARARANGRRALAAGITTIRDLGDRNYVTLDIRDDPDLPTILAAGPPLTADGGHCWFLGGCCTDTDALVAAVHERKARGCDVVKVMVTGGILTPTFPMWASQFTAEQIATVVSTAHAVGLPVAAHCHGAGGTAQAVDAGVDTIEHCTFLGERMKSEPDADIIEAIVAAGITVSATLGVHPDHVPPPIVQANFPVIFDVLRELRRLGGTIVVGTDAGVGPGKPHDVLPHAVRDLVDIGFAAADVVTAMTATAATVCGVGHRKGRLARGYDADIVAVDGDPLRDAAALFDVRYVWRGGRAMPTGV